MADITIFVIHFSLMTVICEYAYAFLKGVRDYMAVFYLTFNFHENLDFGDLNIADLKNPGIFRIKFTPRSNLY